MTNDDALDTSPEWLPDGRLLFSSDRTGVYDLYLFEPGAGRLARRRSRPRPPRSSRPSRPRSSPSCRPSPAPRRRPSPDPGARASRPCSSSPAWSGG